MRLGSVIIDLAAASGGNTEGAEFGKQVEIENVIINSPKNLPSLVSFDASSLYSKNIFNFIYLSLLKYPSILNEIIPFVTIISISFLIRIIRFSF